MFETNLTKFLLILILIDSLLKNYLILNQIYLSNNKIFFEKSNFFFQTNEEQNSEKNYEEFREFDINYDDD